MMLWLLVLTLPCLGGSVPVTSDPGPGTELVGIMGGHDAADGKWPWQVGLWFWNQTNSQWFLICGGSLIHCQWVLTAAHCIPGRNPVTRDFKVQLGRVRLSYNDSVQVARIIRHPKYSLENRVSEQLRPPYNLQEVEVPLVANEICQRCYLKVIKDDELCAGSEGRGTCHGDSGGPLVCKWRETWVQVGVVSWGPKSCLPNVPTVYARVTSFLPWIRRHIRSSP